MGEKHRPDETAKDSFLGRVSRRSFLSQLGAAGVAAASAGPLAAAAQPVAGQAAAPVELGVDKIEGAVTLNLRVNGKPLQVVGGPARDAARYLARERESDRHQEGLRSWPVRRVHGPHQRPPRELLPDACRDA